VSAPLAFRVLGPLEVWRGDRRLAVGGDRQRLLLALLLLQANALVSTDELIEQLFGPSAGVSAANSLQAGISRLRRVLADGEGGVIVTRPRGYVLESEPEWLDSARFEALLASGRAAVAAGDPAAAAAELRQALGLWRGPAFVDVAFSRPQPELSRLESLRLAATMERIEADLALGQSGELVPELEALVAVNPYQERLRGQLILALYRSGRQAEALEVYRATRTLLNEELGLEPSRALQRLERSILRQDVLLDGAAASTAVCPFKGLAPFGASDSAYFFGRERIVDELTTRLAAGGFTGVVGPSGCGKSSIVQAGLLPALRAGALPDSAARRVVLLRPGPTPRLPSTGGAPVVLAVDQLEEVFTLCSDERARVAFLDELAEAAVRPETQVVVALRADFYGRLAEYPRMGRLVSRSHVLVGAMERDELVRAVEQPALRAGLTIEPELVEALVGDVVGRPGALPLLQTTLLELWRRRDGTALRLQSYGASGGVEGAVSRLAEQAYATLRGPEREAARRLLLRLSGGDPAAPVRRRVPVDELDTGDPAPAHALEALTEARLLTVDEGVVEVAHEALLREWPRLRAWLEVDQEGQRLHARLAEQAREWEERGRDPGVLYRGARLAAALDWLPVHDHDVSARERAFLDRSQAAADEEAERRRRANRRLRRLLATVGALLVAAVVAGGLALSQRAAARQAAVVADSRRLGAEALVRKPLDLALLLARQAWNMNQSQDTRGTLLASLLRAPAALQMLRGTGDRVQWIDISPDGTTLVVGDNAGGIALFDARRLRRLGVVHVAGATEGDAFSPDGRIIAAGVQGSEVAFVDLATKRVRYGRFPSGWTTNDRLAYAPDGGAVATSEENWSTHRARIVERRPSTFAVLRAAPQPWLDFVVSVRYTPDGRLLIVSGAQGNGARTFVYDAHTLRLLHTFGLGGVLAPAPDGRTVAVGDLDGSIRFVDLEGRRQPIIVRQDSSIQGLGFSPDGRTLVTVGDGPDVVVWDLASRAIRERLAGHSGRVFGPAFAPDSQTLYTSGLDSSIIAWDLNGSRRPGRPYAVAAGPPPLNRPDAAYLARAVSPDGRRFAVGTLDGSVAMLDRASMRVVARLDVFRRHTQVTALAYSRDGRQLAVGSVDGTAALVRSQDGHRIVGLPRRRFGGSTALAYSHDGSLLAAGGDDGVVQLLEAHNGRRIRLLEAAASTPASPLPVSDLDFNADGRQLAVATGDGFVSVFDATTGRRIWHRRADRWYASSVRFSPDGRLVAAGGSQKGEVVFFDAADGRRDGAPIRAAAGYVLSLDFDPSGRTLATSGTDAAVRLWDAATRQQIGADLPGDSWVGTTFFPDGGHLLAAYNTGRGAVWDVNPTTLAKRACAIVGRSLTRPEWNTYLPHRPYVQTCGV
jgi:WD40 repeat protein/DNA-binding SARP family transcriptional activator